MLPDFLLDEQSRAGYAERLFAPGTFLAIKEPSYKIMQDGTFAVRVDNPQEVQKNNTFIRFKT